MIEVGNDFSSGTWTDKVSRGLFRGLKGRRWPDHYGLSDGVDRKFAFSAGIQLQLNERVDTWTITKQSPSEVGIVRQHMLSTHPENLLRLKHSDRLPRGVPAGIGRPTLHPSCRAPEGVLTRRRDSRCRQNSRDAGRCLVYLPARFSRLSAVHCGIYHRHLGDVQIQSPEKL